MKVEDKGTSFRQWNPEKIDVPWGEDNGSPVDDSALGGCCCCMISGCVNKCFQAVFQEVIHEVKEGKHSLADLIQALHDQNAAITKLLRIGTWFLMVIGIYLLFSPIIALFKWIPLIGWLLGGIIAVAACCFACLCGTIMHLLTMTVAWIFYRPLLGIAMLATVAVIITIMFTVGKGA